MPLPPDRSWQERLSPPNLILDIPQHSTERLHCSVTFGGCWGLVEYYLPDRQGAPNPRPPGTLMRLKPTQSKTIELYQKETHTFNSFHASVRKSSLPPDDAMLVKSGSLVFRHTWASRELLVNMMTLIIAANASDVVPLAYIAGLHSEVIGFEAGRNNSILRPVMTIYVIDTCIYLFFCNIYFCSITRPGTRGGRLGFLKNDGHLPHGNPHYNVCLCVRGGLF